MAEAQHPSRIGGPPVVCQMVVRHGPHARSAAERAARRSSQPCTWR
jgi:hypothetical protein